MFLLNFSFMLTQNVLLQDPCNKNETKYSFNF